MKIWTSYFYQVRNFKSNMIPVSVCVSDPKWYHNFQDNSYCFFDKRHIYNGLRYEYAIVQKDIECGCPCADRRGAPCVFLQNYKDALEQLDFDKVKDNLFYLKSVYARTHLDIYEKAQIVFLFHEAVNNPCSEKKIFQQVFTEHGLPCEELVYQIR